jgi:arabinofuranosyltransferase
LIGGDFMSGRLFTPAVVVGCVLLARQMATQTLTTKLIVLGVVIALGLASPTPTLRTGSAPALTVLDRNGITDERAHYFPQTGLLSMARNAPRPSHDWALQGMQWAERGAIVLAQQAIGMHGYFAGPDVHIVDELGLADALLSRLRHPIPLIGESAISGAPCLTETWRASVRTPITFRIPIWLVSTIGCG